MTKQKHSKDVREVRKPEDLKDVREARKPEDLKDVWEAKKPEDLIKFEIARELGLADKVSAGGWRSLTAKESGRIGGMMTRRKREKSQ